MLYKIAVILLIGFLTSCSSVKNAGTSVLMIVGEVIIDDEIYAPIIDNRNSFEYIEEQMKPDDENIEHFDYLLSLHNNTVKNISLEIIRDGSVLYEDYKLEILQVKNQLGNMRDDYETEVEYQELPDFVVSLIKDWIKNYSRKQVARQFKNKFSYPVR